MAKEFNRTQRLGDFMRQELAKLIQFEVRDPRVGGMVSITDVQIAKDLSHAKVYVTALLPESSLATVKALKELAPEMRYQLAHAVKMRHVPELHFHYDDSVDKGERIDELLRNVAKPESD